MKKLLLSLLGIAFLMSCSNDTQESVTYDDTSNTMMLKSTSADPVLKQLYIDMINSQSYIDYDNAREAFNDKLGTTIPDSEMSSSNKMLSWVQNNITQTGFQNYQEAVDKWDDVETLSSISNQANYGFVEYLGGTTPGTLLLIIQEVEPTPSACPACQKQYMSCINIVYKAYASTMESAADQLKAGDVSDTGYGKIKSIALSLRRKGEANCIRNLNECCQENQE